MQTELKPCPFCGGEAKTNETAGIPKENMNGWGWIGCQKCRVFIDFIDNEIGKEQATAAWNRRANDDQG